MFEITRGDEYMKKLLFKVTAVVMIAIFIVSEGEPILAKDNPGEIYRRFLKRNESKFVVEECDWDTVNSEDNKKSDCFLLVDLSKDGTPELVCNHPLGYKQDMLYVYYEKGGKTNLLTDEGGVSTIIMTDGKFVYYFVANRFEKSFYDYYEIDTVYEKNMSTHATKEVFSIKTKDGIHFAGYYSGKIFYVKNIDPGTLCSYNLKTGKNRTLLRNVTNANQYGRVFLCNPYAGGGPPFKFFTYNAKSNKSRTLTKQLMCYRVIKKRIYFVEYVRSYDNSDYISYDDYIGNVIRCDLNGKHKKILLKNQRIQGVVDKITSSYLTYKNSALDRSYKIYY